MSLVEITSRPPAGSRLGGIVGVAVMAGLALWLAAYVSGICPWLGYENWSRHSIGWGQRHFITGESRSGGSFGLGLGSFVFFEGQTIVVSYDVEVRRGCLWMHVWHLFHHGPDDSVSQCVAASGKGEWTVPVSETGIYDIIIDSSPIKGPGPGWDISYELWWGARW